MIPVEFNFIYLYGPQTRSFDINHMISIMSNIEVSQPKVVRLFTNDIKRFESNKYFNRLRSQYKNIIELVDTDEINTELTSLLGYDPSTIPYMAHLADIYRLYIMSTYGGVYSDVDSIAVNPFPESYWNATKPIYYPEVYDTTPDSLCNGFFLAPKGSQFLKIWLSHYIHYNPEDCKPGTPDWTKFSVQLGWKLYKMYSDEIILCDDPREIEPMYLTYKDTQSIFYLDRSDMIESSYQMHLWETRNRDLLKIIDEDYFRECNSTYAKLGRRYL